MKLHSKIITITVLACLLAACKKDKNWTGQSDFFIKYFGNSVNDHGYDLKQTSDGGFIIVGTTTPDKTNKTNTDVILIKTDDKGNKQWSKTFGGPNADIGKSVQITSDEGYVVLGTYSKTTDKDMYLIRTDAGGNLMWFDTLGGKYNQVGNCVQVTSNGSFVLAGSSDSSNSNLSTLYLVKANANGSPVWSTKIPFDVGNVDSYYGNYLQLIDDNTFFIVGLSSGSGNKDVWALIGYKQSGSPANIPPSFSGQYYGNSGNAEGLSAQKLTNDEYVVVGYQGNSLYLADLINTSTSTPQPAINWQKTQSLPPGAISTQGRSIKLSSDGGFIIIGTANKGGGNTDQYLLKTDVNGNKIWDQTFGGTGADEGEVVIQTKDGGYALIGSSDLESNTVMTLIKVTSEGIFVSFCLKFSSAGLQIGHQLA